MTSRAITDPDERQTSPARMASLMGWHRPRHAHGWSWALLLEVAHRKYDENRPTQTRTEQARAI